MPSLTGSRRQRSEAPAFIRPCQSQRTQRPSAPSSQSVPGATDQQHWWATRPTDPHIKYSLKNFELQSCRTFKYLTFSFWWQQEHIFYFILKNYLNKWSSEIILSPWLISYSANNFSSETTRWNTDAHANKAHIKRQQRNVKWRKSVCTQL